MPQDTYLRVKKSQVSHFWTLVRKTDSCWEWIGRLAWNGYGRFRVNGTQIGAHRLSYLLERGPIGHGMVIDHLCRNRACVNPDHLEVVTQKENVNRGLNGVLKPNRGFCPKGHAIVGENALPNKRGNPRCRRCNREYLREYKLKLAAAK